MSINVNNVKSLFELFSGEDANSEWTPVIIMAVLEVRNMLLPDADDTDTRLEFLAAAVANYRTQEIKLSSGKREYEYVGWTAAARGRPSRELKRSCASTCSSAATSSKPIPSSLRRFRQRRDSMRDILNAFKAALLAAGNENVYLAFDALPVRGKRGHFTVLGIKSFEATTPVYSQFTVFMPFRAEVEVSVYAPESEDMQTLYRFFENSVRPALDAMASLTTRICRLSIRHDTTLKRLVLTVGVSVSGIRRIARDNNE